MAASSLVILQPPCNFSLVRSLDSGSNRSPPRSTLSLRSRRSSLILPLGFLLHPRIGAVYCSKSMNEQVKTFASIDGGSNGGEEQIQALEQEAFIGGSSGHRDGSIVGGGVEASLNHLSKWIVSALFGSVLLLRHDGAALWFAIGSVSNSMLSIALKRVLNQDRPVPNLRSDPGMPSSHAQSISYISMFAVLTVLEWLGINEVSLFISGLILAWGSYFTWLRVSQKLHTVSQVAVGAIVGTVFCILWYLTWNLVVFEAFASSFAVQVFVFLVAAAFGLGFAVYVVRKWFRDDR